MPKPKEPRSIRGAPPASAATELRFVGVGAKPLTKQQRDFNRLLKEVRRLQARLDEWREFDGAQQQRVASELVPELARLREAHGEFVRACASVLEDAGDKALRKVERRHLVAAMIEACEELFAMTDGADPELVAIYDRHAPRSHGELERERVEALREDLRAQFGIELPADIEPDEIEDFLRRAADVDAAARDRDARRRRAESEHDGHLQTGESAARQRTADMRHTLRDIYRKLASALHPDRAVGDADRERRHGLMQRANAAYASSDLFALLELQLAADQVDSERLGRVEGATLRDYIGLLRDRIGALKEEIATITERFAMTIGAFDRAVTREALVADLEHAVQAARRDTAHIHESTACVRDATLRKAWLADWVRAKQAEDRDDRRMRKQIEADVEALSEMFGFVDVRIVAPRARRPRRRR